MTFILSDLSKLSNGTHSKTEKYTLMMALFYSGIECERKRQNVSGPDL